MNSELDAFFDGSCSDGLVEGPAQGAYEPSVAGVAGLVGSFVDAFEHVFRDAEKHFLIHTRYDSRLASMIAKVIA